MSEESDQLHQFLLARHTKVRDALQTTLRQIGILAIVAGIGGGLWNAWQYRSDIGFLVWAQDIGEGIIWCVLLYALAAIVDALRVIAANSFKDAPGSRRADALPGADAKQ